MACGDAAMYGALAGSVLFSLSPDAQREKVLLYLLVSVAPFAVVAPAIGPTVDRIPGGRRMVAQLTAVGRAFLYLAMAMFVDSVVLYPLIFGAMVLQKTYAVSKSALVPSVVRTDAELVEANSKLSLISGVVGALAIGPLAGVGHLSPEGALVIGAVLFLWAMLAANRLPRDVVASTPPDAEERHELRSAGVLLAAGAMAALRSVIGFLTFHLFFWMREDFGLFHVGLAAGASTLGSMSGNALAPRIRRMLREERMLVTSLLFVTVAGLTAALVGGLVAGVALALVVNLSASSGRLAFDAIVQRDAPDANQGRAFARFETRFQLAWVLSGLPPVLFTLPGAIGFLVVGLVGLGAGTSYFIGQRAVRSGLDVPTSLTRRAGRRLQATAARRRADTTARGLSRPPMVRDRTLEDPPRPATRRVSGRGQSRVQRRPSPPPSGRHR